MSLLRKVFSAHTLEGGQSFDSFFRSFNSVSHSTAGEAVTENSALTLSAYWAAVRNIAEDIGKLPIRFYKKMPNGDKLDVASPRLINIANLLTTSPNVDMAAPSIKETLTYHALNSGNGFAEIQRDNGGRPVALHPIHPDRVTIIRDEMDNVTYQINASFPLGVTTTFTDNEMVVIPQMDMFHIHGLAPNGIAGYPVLHLARDVIGSGLAQQGFHGAFYRNGTHLGGVLSTPEQLSDNAIKHLRESWNDKFNGADRAWKPAILEQDLKWQQLGVNPKDAEALDSRKFNVIEIARILRIPPHKIQSLDNATFTNIESQNLEYTTDTLQPWVNRWEHEIKRKIIPSNDINVCAEFIFKELLRGTPSELSALQNTYFNMGVLSPNEIRGEIGLNRIDEEAMDKHYVQLNLQAVEDMPDDMEAMPVSAMTEPVMLETEAEMPTMDNMDDMEVINKLIPIYADTASRVVRKEIKAFDRIKSKFINDQVAYTKWVNEFKLTQNTYIKASFSPIISSISGKKDLDLDEITANYWEKSVNLAKEDDKVAYLTEIMVNFTKDESK